MKPNLIVLHLPNTAPDIEVEKLCERFCETHYVYLIRPGSVFREDSPSGIRFLNHSMDRLPGFADVALAIAVGDPEVEEMLRSAYPESTSTRWNPSYGDDFSDSMGWDIPGSIVRGEFAKSDRSGLALAM